MVWLPRRQSLPYGSDARRRISAEHFLHHIQTASEAGLCPSVESQHSTADPQQMDGFGKLHRHEHDSRTEWDGSKSIHFHTGRQLRDQRTDTHAVFFDRKHKPAPGSLSAKSE